MRNKSLDNTRIQTGQITPSLTIAMILAQQNMSAGSIGQGGYLRIGNIVTAFGKITIDPVAPATLTILQFSVTFASNFANNNELAGVAFCVGVAGQGAALRASTTNDCVEMAFIATDINSQDWYYNYTYRII